MSPTGDLFCNPGMWSVRESNQQPFGLQADTQSTEPYQPGPNPTNLGIVEIVLSSLIPQPLQITADLSSLMWLVKFLYSELLLTSPANSLTVKRITFNSLKLPEYTIHTMVSHLLVFVEATFPAWHSSLSSLQPYLANTFSFKSLLINDFLQEAFSDTPMRCGILPESWNFFDYGTHHIAMQFSLYISGHPLDDMFLKGIDCIVVTVTARMVGTDLALVITCWRKRKLKRA